MTACSAARLRSACLAGLTMLLSLLRADVSCAQEKPLVGLIPKAGPITMDGPSHAPIQNVSLAMTSGHGFKVFATYKNQKPTFEMQVCNLIKNPTINKQFTP